MTKYVERAGLQVADVLADLVEEDILPDLGLKPQDFWGG